MSSFGSSSGIQEFESRSNPSPEQIFDNRVFLSFKFKGEDSLVSFTSHLYTSLENAGAYVFFIDEELRSGDQVSPSRLQAIEWSRASVIVFSKNYADSRWNLEELEKIMECHRTMGQVVVPVFYGVDPSEVHHQTGMFGEAFRHLIQGISLEKDKVLSWRAVLREACGIQGFHVKESGFYRNESEDIKNVVGHVTSLLDITDCLVDDHLVGVESRVQDVITLLNNQKSKDVLLLGVWGMGGIGKTTIAKAIYKRIGCNFVGKSFLPFIREVWEQINGQVSLQEKHVSDIYKTTKIQIQSIEAGKMIIKERLCNRKVLLILDDVNELEQLNALCGSREWFGPGSIIIITTRDKHLLSLLGVDHVYRMTEMDESESVDLFSRYAFKQASPGEYFAGVYRSVSYCGGLPLALVRFGSTWFKRKINDSKYFSQMTTITSDDYIIEKLRISFDGLSDDKEKEIFLHIAHFFIGRKPNIGMDLDDVIQRLNSFGLLSENAINVLIERSLVTIDEKNMLRMHPLLQEMGKEIIHERSSGRWHGVGFYDVFLSFRGEDTRASFTSHLHSSLQNAGIYVFRDDDEIPRGDHISSSLMEGIERSRISIIIFSRNYANSRWCMQELEEIIECRRTRGKVVVPVFYGVAPTEVRHQTGKFGEAFEDLIQRCKMKKDKVLSWRRALREAGGIAGFVVIDSRNESEDIKNVVEHIIHLLDKKDLFVADHPVGVESRVQDVIKLFNNQQSKDVLLLGIWGMGGIGKTTIAKAIYNQIGRNFEGRSFLQEIREVWEQDNGQVYLQERLLSNIYKTMKIKIHSTEEGKNILREKLVHKKVLLVLDDVDKLEQLNVLSGSREWFGPGSRIIITTRDEHILRVHRVDRVCRVKEMDESESIELFSWHAFNQESPREDFAGLSRNVVAYSSGLPLALEVLGSYLFDRGMVEWKSVLE